MLSAHQLHVQLSPATGLLCCAQLRAWKPNQASTLLTAAVPTQSRQAAPGLVQGWGGWKARTVTSLLLYGSGIAIVMARPETPQSWAPYPNLLVPTVRPPKGPKGSNHCQMGVKRGLTGPGTQGRGGTGARNPSQKVREVVGGGTL